MRHSLRWIFTLILIDFLLSSCGGQTPPPSISTLPPQAFASPVPTQPACTVVAAAPTPAPDDPSRFAPVSAEDRILGPADAPVTIVIYDDFQCTDCNYLPLRDWLIKEHADQVRFVFRVFPYPDQFDKGLLAAQAAEAAGLQDKFWDMHDLLFQRQADWVNLAPAEFEAWVEARAAELGLDPTRFESDFDSAAVQARVQKAADDGVAAGIPVLPFLLINGQIYSGPTDYVSLDRVVSLIALGERQFSSCPPFEIDATKQYIATLKTEKGDVVIELYADKAPFTVNSFVFLARRGWFDNITWHRVLPGFVAQTGDPSGTGAGNPGYFIINETEAGLKFDGPGLVGMANSGIDTNGSQFFITYDAAPHLDGGGYTVFGRVLSGMDVLAQLTPRDPQQGVYLPPGDRLITVIIEER